MARLRKFDEVLDSVVAAFDSISSPISRIITRQTDVRGLKIGGSAEVLVQSMTGVKTSDIDATVTQIKELSDAGSPLVRIAFRDYDDAEALPKVKARLVSDGYEWVRLALCMHFNGHLLLEKYPECIDAADKLRINPGNVGFLDKWDDQCARIIKSVNKFSGKAVRIGVNWGSVDQSLQDNMMDVLRGRPKEDIEVITLVISAITTAKFIESCDFNPNQIVISCKVSEPSLTVLVNTCLSMVCDYPLHIGVTEAGEGDAGIVNTACGLTPLLRAGIGNTIRASLTDHKNSPRTREVQICKLILQSLGIKNFAPSITSCPGCGRAKSDFFKNLTVDIKSFIAEQMQVWRDKYKGVENLKVAVMGCIVNGPGESKRAHIGISLPGYGEGDSDAAVVYIDGERYKILKGSAEAIFDACKEIIIEYVMRKYSALTDAS